MTTTVRWGILSTGRIARAFANALKDTPGAVLHAVASRDLASAQAFAQEFGAAKAYGSYQELADDTDVELVYIGTPHTLHARDALMALKAGKGVLCEKAFTVNRREAEEVVALARSKKLFLMEAMWSRFLPALAEVRRIIDSGEIGPARTITADFGFYSEAGPEHRLFNPALGGGALLDLGIYPLSLSAALLGPVESVRAQAELGPTGVDLQTAFTLKHRGGGISACSCSVAARTPCELTVSGTRGQVRMNTRFHQATSITVTLDDGSSRTIPTPFTGNGYSYEAIEAQRCYLAGLLESPHMTHGETLEQMGVMDEVRRQVGVSYSADAA
ncbi:Gfo/Idh/MocA family oxidoreductase [Massilia terrae]|uniref:Gfo/Idh/MocA family oxidoreductase n=1 Tax=Massilia terrae TaxID=1811224 RepID=A0ABT2D474_9BURK|nr:Gfo/Idh/MocA family oxidoreductase [Massilia terrae]MCS0660919.1 Gfo/Idh/MocA family oxidoreductase [Massilia terrae]